MFWAARLHTWPDSKRLGVHWHWYRENYGPGSADRRFVRLFCLMSSDVGWHISWGQAETNAKHIICGSGLKYNFCRDKSFARLSRQKNACLSRQKFCLFFATKNCLFVATKVLPVCRDKNDTCSSSVPPMVEAWFSIALRPRKPHSDKAR